LDVSVDGLFPVHYACIVGIVDIIKMIVTSDPTEVKRLNSFGYTPLHIAVANEHLQLVLLLIKLGADPIEPSQMNGNTALHVAMRSENTKLVECLVAPNPDVLVQANKEKKVALMVAQEYGNEIMIQLLTRLLKREVVVPMFEVVYLKYVDKESEQARSIAHQDVIEMLCNKMQAYLDSEPPEEGSS
jgi:ankyrin repeat protein